MQGTLKFYNTPEGFDALTLRLSDDTQWRPFYQHCSARDLSYSSLGYPGPQAGQSGISLDEKLK